MRAPRITLATGGERVLVDRTVLAVSAAVRAEDPTAQRTVIFASSDNAAADLMDAAMPTLFGNAGVVVVEGIDAENDKLGLAIRELIAAPPEGVCLVFTHPGGNKGKGLVDAIKAAGAEVVACQSLKRGRETTEFLTREFSSHRRKATSDAIAALTESVGQDLGLLVSAVSQLCADIESNPIDADDVRQYFEGVAEVSGFVISDAVWERRFADALRSLRQAMLSDSSRVGPGTVASLANGLRGLVRVGGMPPGTPESDIAREAGVPPWKVGPLRRQWSRWSGDQRRLAAAVVALADADGAMKGGVLEGSHLDPEQKLLALEILVARTAATSARD